MASTDRDRHLFGWRKLADPSDPIFTRFSSAFKFLGESSVENWSLMEVQLSRCSARLTFRSVQPNITVSDGRSTPERGRRVYLGFDACARQAPAAPCSNLKPARMQKTESCSRTAFSRNDKVKSYLSAKFGDLLHTMRRYQKMRRRERCRRKSLQESL